MLSNRTTLRIIVFGCVDSQMICTDLETYQHFVELVLMTILVFPDTTVCLYVDDIISICSMRRLKFSVPHRPNANAHGHDGGFSECCATSQLGTSWMRGTDDPVRETKRVKKIAFCRHVICSFIAACTNFSYRGFVLPWPVFRRALSSEDKLTSDSEYFTDQFLSLSCYGTDLSKAGLLLS